MKLNLDFRVILVRSQDSDETKGGAQYSQLSVLCETQKTLGGSRNVHAGASRRPATSLVGSDALSFLKERFRHFTAAQ